MKNFLEKIRATRSAVTSGSLFAAGVVNDFFTDTIKPLFGSLDSKSPAAAESVGKLITSIISILLLVAASIAVVYLMIGGYRYVMARGNEEASEAAKKTISSSVIGLIIIVLAFAIIRIIASVLVEGSGGLNI